MLARRLRELLAVEILTYGLLIGLAIQVDAVSGALAISIILLLALGCRTLPTALLFMLSRRYATPVARPDRLSFWSWCSLFGSEWLALTRLYSSLQVFPKHWVANETVIDDSVSPILLVHGYACNEGFWRPLIRSLDSIHAPPLETLNLEPVFGDLDTYVEQLNYAIEALCERCLARTVTIVAHSMGGLVSRRYVQRYGANRVNRLILLGTPHHGTGLAYWGLGRNARQMELDSTWLQTLNQIHIGIPTFNLHSSHDTIVSPQDSALLPVALNQHNIPVGAVGHLDMAFNRRVHDHVIEALSL